jgi:hypothetical protein
MCFRVLIGISTTTRHARISHTHTHTHTHDTTHTHTQTHTHRHTHTHTLTHRSDSMPTEMQKAHRPKTATVMQFCAFCHRVAKSKSNMHAQVKPRKPHVGCRCCRPRCRIGLFFLVQWRSRSSGRGFELWPRSSSRTETAQPGHEFFSSTVQPRLKITSQWKYRFYLKHYFD